jgi:hypothetical protein
LLDAYKTMYDNPEPPLEDISFEIYKALQRIEIEEELERRKREAKERAAQKKR